MLQPSKNTAIVDTRHRPRCASPPLLRGRCCTMHCRWENPKTAPSLEISLPCPEEDGATAIGNMYRNLAKIARVVSEIFSRTDRQTHTHRHTDVVITILRKAGTAKFGSPCSTCIILFTSQGSQHRSFGHS